METYNELYENEVDFTEYDEYLLYSETDEDYNQLYYEDNKWNLNC